jgi:hypothetical protein
MEMTFGIEIFNTLNDRIALTICKKSKLLYLLECLALVQ